MPIKSNARHRSRHDFRQLIGLLLAFFAILLGVGTSHVIARPRSDAGFYANPSSIAAPRITPATGITRQQGSLGDIAQIATVSDAETPAGDLAVAVVSAPQGIIVIGIVNDKGAVSATVVALCNALAGPNLVELSVTDGEGLTNSAELSINVVINTPPNLSNYPAVVIGRAGGTVVAPAARPADNGVIASLVVTSENGFRGGMIVNPVTGNVTIRDARPTGTFTITVTSADNCGTRSAVDFQLTVIKLDSGATLSASAGPYISGQPVTLTAVVAGVPPVSLVPTGTMTFFDGPKQLGTATLNAAGEATLMTTEIGSGPRGITAIYSGDSNFNPSNSNAIALDVAGAVTNVSAANYKGEVIAPDQIIAAFGSHLANASASSTATPLPTVLGGTAVRVRDSAGTERLAPLFFVSPSQVNYLAPPGMAQGPASVTVLAGDGSSSLAYLQIAATSPGIFSADSSGNGLAAAEVLRVKADGSQSFEAVARFDETEKKFVAIPIDFGAATDQLFLVAYATGVRYRSSLTAVTAKLGGTDVEVVYAGPQGPLVGLDQLNFRLSRSLAGRGEVDLVITVDGKMVNVVKVNFK